MKDPLTSSPGEQASPDTRHNAQSTRDDAHATHASSEQWQASGRDNGVYLHSLSELAGCSFASTTEALGATLKLIVDQLGLRSSFVTAIDRETCQNEVIAAYNVPGGCDVPAKALLELPETF
ncbi:MAG: hypothetical protein AVDCRST_MAG93-2449 [uncultured Chloroflexia bacterium]|uniref:Uncharacterized protein n=1 Tax=uncultured Chloroflexia bacterium TaxID=1672391 RepID=A0A6J4IZX2_9CHLR|nr:MAG: hypothetical protein AVDCRST_MAG93-2449 [uncultured Chloroflexia bacterium]